MKVQLARPRKEAASISLFPFMDVFLCIKGALILMFIVIAQSSGDPILKAVYPHHEMPLDDAQAEIAELEKRLAQAQAEREAASQRFESLRGLQEQAESESHRLNDELAAIEMAASQSPISADDETLATLRSERARVAAELAAERRKKKPRESGESSYSIIPHDAPDGTHRRPIYIECRRDSIILQPQGIELAQGDFQMRSRTNPLAAAVIAGHDYLMNAVREARQTGEPYPLLLVRPDGIAAYQVARAAISELDCEFGYELIEADWKLDYGAPDERLTAAMRQAVDAARRHQAQLAQAAPSWWNERERNARRGSNLGSRNSGRGGFGSGDGGGDAWASSDGHGYGSRAHAMSGGSGGSFPGDNPYAAVDTGPDSTGGLSGGGGGSGGTGVGGGGAGGYAAAGGNSGPGGTMLASAGTGSGGIGGPGGAGGDNRYATGGSGPGSSGGGVGFGTGGKGPGSQEFGYNVGGGGAGPGGNPYASAAGGPYSPRGGSGFGGPGAGSSGDPNSGALVGSGGGGNGMLGAGGAGGAQDFGSGGGGGSGTTGSGSGSGGGPGGGSPDGSLSAGGNPYASVGTGSGAGGGTGAGGGPSGGTSAGGMGSAGGSPGSSGGGGASSASGGGASGSAGGPNLLGASGQPSASGGGMNLPFGLSAGGMAGGNAAAGNAAANSGASDGSYRSTKSSSAAGPGSSGGVAGGSAAAGSTDSSSTGSGGQGKGGQGGSGGSSGKGDGKAHAHASDEKPHAPTGISRPISVECHADRLVLAGEEVNGSDSQVIRFDRGMTVSMNELTTDVRKRVESWGLAGRGMQWQPILSVHVAPDADARYAEIETWLKGSGLQVQRANTPPATAPASKPAGRLGKFWRLFGRGSS